MDTGFFEKAYKATLSDNDFERLARLIEKESGIKMPSHKKVMLQSRLKKRLYQLGMSDFNTYCNYVFDPEKGEHETLFLLNFISTNKTDFFREPIHFDYLEKKILPDLIHRKDRLKLWSAGCSSGEEVYSLAIIMEEVRKHHPQMDYSIVGTDISGPMLEKAAKAVYKESNISDIPLQLRKQYLLRNKNSDKPLIRIGPQLRKKVKFTYLNLMENNYTVDKNFDIVFFRNVMIYFNKEVQEMVLHRIMNHLSEGGYLFIGHSENILNINLPLVNKGPNIFQKQSKK